MNRKKPQFLMVSMVGVLVLTLITINLTQYLRAPGMITEYEAPDPAKMKLLKERSEQVTGPDGSRLNTMTAPRDFGKTSTTMAAAEIPATPSIKMPKAQDYLPTFDSATTSSHWYDDDSYQKVNAKANEGKRTDTSQN